MDGQNWRGLKWNLGKFEKRRPTFFQIYVISTARKSWVSLQVPESFVFLVIWD